MKSFFAIVVAALYFAFSVGLTIHVHQCDEAALISNDFLSNTIVPAMDDCHQEEVHPCCESEKESSCCSSSQNNSEDDCCIEAHFLIQIEEEQLVSKNQFNIPLPIALESISCDLSIEYEIDSSEKSYFDAPPPLKEDRHIRYCTLTLYG